MKIGFIGLGTMGRGMVKNLAKHHQVVVWNRTHAVAERIVQKNVEATESIPWMSGADIIFTCVANDRALNEIVFDKGLLKSMRKGQTLVDSGTTSIELTEKIAQACADQGINFLDAPITGSKNGAEGGTLMFMAGGDRIVFDKTLPVLQTMGTRFVYCGTATYGQRAKLALNITQAAIFEAYFEGLIFGVKNGVPLDAMSEIFENSGAKSGVGTVKSQTIRKRDFSEHFKHSLMHKDVLLATRELQKLDLDFPIFSRLPAIFESSRDRHTEDFSTIVKNLEKKAGIELK